MFSQHMKASLEQYVETNRWTYIVKQHIQTQYLNNPSTYHLNNMLTHYVKQTYPNTSLKQDNIEAPCCNKALSLVSTIFVQTWYGVRITKDNLFLKTPGRNNYGLPPALRVLVALGR